MVLLLTNITEFVNKSTISKTINYIEITLLSPLQGYCGQFIVNIKRQRKLFLSYKSNLYPQLYLTLLFLRVIVYWYCLHLSSIAGMYSSDPI